MLGRYRMVLASGSPRRVRILKEQGVSFRQLVPNIDETNGRNLPPYKLAVHLAEEKAAAVMNMVTEDEVILGCDTIVILDDEIIGKPSDQGEAAAMLGRLSGRKHTVCSAVALVSPGNGLFSGYELTEVYFNEVSRQAIEAYVVTGEPLDKAGAYGIQGRGVFLVDTIRGNIDNVIGLPMTLVNELAGKVMGGRNRHET